MSAFSPRRILVKEVIRSRYPKGARPASWDERCSGIDQIKSDDGETVTLYSDGQQSPPQVGWTILLTSPVSVESFSDPRGVELKGPTYRWTLYGMGAGLRSAHGRPLS